MSALSIETECCIAGGGPAGMMLGFLLARAGVRVAVLEKHPDFLRDFRGDTIHPSTLQLLHELGLLEAFLQRPHSEIGGLTAEIGDSRLKLADLRYLPTACKFIALMPQWDFLNFLAEAARRLPTFRLIMNAPVDDLLTDGATVCGVRATTPDGPLTVRARLVVGADGRTSTVRARAGLEVRTFGAPIDVLWMRISRRADDQADLFARIDYGRMMVMIDRGDYWQCAYVIEKGGADALRARGIDAFRADIAQLVPFLRDRLGELRDWDDVKLLTVAIDRLKHWFRPGLLCIGDAAHAMSPVGGVGINLAVQDAVAAANILYPAFAHGPITLRHLRAVQVRRTFPTVVIQRVQVIFQKVVLTRVLRGGGRRMKPPLFARLLDRIAMLRALPAFLIGIGPRPEHVHTPDRGGTRSGA